MATYNKEDGVVLTQEDEKALRENKSTTNRIMNWVVWGNPKGILTIKKNNQLKQIYGK